MSKRLLLLAALCLALHAAAQVRVPAPMEDDNHVTDLTLDSLNKARTARPVSGSTRRGSHPVLFLVGNSTMRVGTLGNGSTGQWGWGYYLHEYFDEEQLTVENHALGGTSSRTFYRRLWPQVLRGVRQGDWVLIELGHNDNGPYDSGRARATIPGIGTDSLQVTIQETGEQETVYTYGEYMRRFVREVKAKGATPILCSLTPRNAWDDADSTRLTRVSHTYGLWARQVAEAEHIPFIDLNEITARKYERYGKEKVKYMFYLDRIHTSAFGARVNAESAVEAIRSHPRLELARYLKPMAADTLVGATRQPGKPMLFTIGDSTVKNRDNDPDGMWGWGSVIAQYFDTARIAVENWAKAGRSARTYLTEGRWQKLYDALQPGDYLLIQFGHNDGSPVDSGRERGDLPGTGSESKVYQMPSTRRYEVVYTYGWYLRKFVNDAKEKGAIPILLSQAPRDKWQDGRLVHTESSYAQWASEVAQSCGIPFIDLNALSSARMEAEGQEAAARYFNTDHTHSSLQGAHLNAESVVQGLKESSCTLKTYLKE